MKTSKHRPQKRTLGLESLESRELLSVAPLTYPVDSTVEYRESDWFEQVSERPTLSLTSEGVIGNEWIIQLKDNVLPKISSVKMAAEYLDDYGVTVIGGLGAIGTLLVCIEEGTPAQQNDILSGVDYIDAWEQNYISVNSSIADVFDDPQATNQWYLDTLNILPAWEQTTGDGVVVAVIDSGIQLDNPDLQDNIWTNPGEIAGNGIDDEGNGFVDDVHGWNTIYLNNNVADTLSHGTQVSSVLGAVGNNSHGTVGVSPNAKILPVKAGSSVFGSSDVISGINYAIKLKTEHSVNINVINISIGIATHEIYNASLDAAGKADILVVIGAGNNAEDNDQAKSYPNQFDNVIVVAATDQNDTLSWFSSYGNTSVDLTAPGERIWIPYHTIGQGSYFGYTYGTSFSAPMVSGAAALLASAHPDWTAAQIKEAILATVDVLPSLEGKVASGGRLNIGNAINYNPAIQAISPAAPTGLSIEELSDHSLRFHWTDNSRNESLFELQYSSDNGVTWNIADDRIPRNSTSTIYLPTRTGDFQFRIRASNAFYASPWSSIVSLQTDSLPIPAAPGMWSVSTHNGLIQQAWSHVLDASSYRLERSISGQNNWTVVYDGENNSYKDDDLDAFVSYDYRLYSIRFGVASMPLTRTIASPIKDLAAPSGLAVQLQPDGKFKLDWMDNTNAETGFELQYRYNNGNWISASSQLPANATTTSVTLSQAGTYEFRIRSVRTTDASTWSNTASIVKSTSDTPLPPTSLNASTMDEAIILAWSPVIGASAYRLERSLSGQNNWSVVYEGTESHYDDKYITPDASYDYRVYAISGNVVSQASEIRTQLSPPTTKPSDIVAVAESDKIINLSWKEIQGANSYIIERSTDGTNWKKIATVTNATTYQNRSLAAATTYFYRISSAWYTVTMETSDIVIVKTKLASTIVPTLKVTSSQIGITDVGTISIVPTRTTPSSGLSYFIEYTCAIDAKRKPDWSQSIIEKVSGSTHRLQTTLNQNTQYYARIVATETDYALADLPAWNTLFDIGIGKEAKFKTKAAPLAKITTSGYAMSSGGEFGVKLRITNPQQNDNARNPLLPDGTTFSYQLIVADDKAKSDKVTGILATGTFAPLSLGNVTFTETMVKNKKYFDSPVILFRDIARLGDMTKMKSVQFQILVTYTMPDGVVTTAASKAAKLTLPKWFV